MTSCMFETKVRTFNKPKPWDMSQFEFLDVSDRKFACDIRAYLNKWFLHYPSHDAQRLLSNFKKDHFHSAFFELYMHELFRRVGYHVTVNDQTASGRTPDFLLSKCDSDKCYVEATLINEEDERSRSDDNRRDMIHCKINEKLSSQLLFLRIGHFEILSDRHVSLRPLIRELKKYISQWESDIIDGITSDAFSYHCEEFKIEVFYIPKTKPLKSESIIGIYGGVGGRWINPSGSIKHTISKKCRKYSDLNTPLVIAVNLQTDYGLDWSQIEDALYGDGVFHYSQSISSRKENGSFQPQANTRLSGVLIGNVHRNVLFESTFRYYSNPYASYPYTFKGIFEEYKLEDNDVSKSLNAQSPLSAIMDDLNHWQESNYDFFDQE